MPGGGDWEGCIYDILSHRAKITPDFSTLAKIQYHPVFVFGTEKKGYKNNVQLGQSPYLGTAHTKHTYWKMKSNAWNVAVYETDMKDMQRERIRGEAYLCNPETVHTLDDYHQNGRMTRRVKTMVVLEEQLAKDWDMRFLFQDTPWTWAWFWVTIPEYWEKLDMELGQLSLVPPRTYHQGPYAIQNRTFYEFHDETWKLPKQPRML